MYVFKKKLSALTFSSVFKITEYPPVPISSFNNELRINLASSVSCFTCTSVQPWLMQNLSVSHQIISSVNILCKRFRWKVF